MVSFYAQGGLGNQLFQYAAARQIAHRTATQVEVDTSWYDKVRSNVTPRTFELYGVFKDLQPLPPRRRAVLKIASSRFGRALPRFMRASVIRETNFSYSEQLLHATGASHIVGYWQSERYFTGVADAIRSELSALTDGICNAELLEITRRANTVAVHVRRGDYVTNSSAAAHHGTCSPAYYSAAISSLSAELPDPHYVVFSDEIEWARTNLTMPVGTTYVEATASVPPIRDILLMASCAHNIIANSSYSWWGAWLGNPKRNVIAPQVWFSSRRETPDLLPSHWKTL